MSHDESSQPLMGHLLELRSRILKILVFVTVVFVALLYFSNDIYNLISAPLVKKLPTGSMMIATDIAAPFFTPIKLTVLAAIFVSIPYILYQIWAFIAPALYQHERKLVTPLIVSSSLLFYLGVAFAYFIVFPLAFGFFVSTMPDNIAMNTDMTKYLDFVMSFFLAFGFSFEVPVAIVLLCWSGFTTAESLRQKRPYIIVMAFVVGMLLTPPDVLSQILLAVPICILFEIGLFFSRFYEKKPTEAA